MYNVWRWLRRHPLATSLFGLLWLATWALTVLTWERDAAGYSIGMSPSVIPLHCALPVFLGVIVGLYATAALGFRARRFALVGAVFGVVEFVILALVDLVWLPAVEVPQPLSEMVVGAIVGALIYAGISAVLSILGGGLGAGWTSLSHRADGAR